MQNLDKEIEFYESQKTELEASQMGKWILIYQQKVTGVFESFEDAADYAVKNFGSGPYLIRQIGAKPLVLPVSVMYRI